MAPTIRLPRIGQLPPGFRALRCEGITLHRITAENAESVREMLRAFEDAGEMIEELDRSYLPRVERRGRVRKIGFWATRDETGDHLAGLSLLGVDSYHRLEGYTGADVPWAMRGRGTTPATKPHLFHVGFALLGLNRLATGCFVSNAASRRSIEKTPGFVYEGTTRESGRNDDGVLEDELRYAILRRDWERLYTAVRVEVIA